MTWWGWMIIGAILFGAELFAVDAQFYLVFLGLSAALVGLLGLAGANMQEWAQWLLFAALSLVSMFTFRKSLYEKIRGNDAEVREGVTGDFVEIKNINPPPDVLGAMEKQMRAEREKRAVILTSEGERDAKINQAEGEKQRVIKEFEAKKQQQINEADGEAAAILAVATATADGLHRVAEVVTQEGGDAAMQLRIAQQYIEEFGNLAKAGNTLVVPANLADLGSMMALATNIAKSKAPTGST